MAMAKAFIDTDDGHDWLVLVPNGHAYLRFISDLAAYGPAAHDGSVNRVVVAVMAWLSTRRDAIPTVTPGGVLNALPRFKAEKLVLDVAWSGQPPWSDVVMAAIQVAKSVDRR
jgi:hypothetical protein